MTSHCGRSVVQVLVVRVDIGVVIYAAMTPQCGRSVVQVLVVRMDIGMVAYEAMTPLFGRSVVQVLVVRVDIGVVIYEAMTPKCGRTVVQMLVVRVDIGVVIYAAMTPQQSSPNLSSLWWSYGLPNIRILGDLLTFCWSGKFFLDSDSRFIVAFKSKNLQMFYVND